jgi:3-dehydroquinate synthase
LDWVCLEHIIQQADAIKAIVVQKDEQEKDLRRILNYGHTAGHVIETMMDYKGYKHGEAVAVGMIIANRIAQKLGMLNSQDTQRIKKLIERAGLPTQVAEKLALDEFMNILKLDKKVEEGKVNFVLPVRIGEVVVRNDVSEEMVREIIKDVCKCD